MASQKFIKIAITGKAGTCRIYAARLIEKALMEAGFPSVSIAIDDEDEQPLSTLDKFPNPILVTLPEVEIDIITVKNI